MAVQFNETQETIDVLRRVVDTMDKEHGRINADELWKGVHYEPFAILHSNPTVTRQGLREMEDFLDVLYTLASTFETHISFVRARVRTPRLTLESLPDDILLEILNCEGMGLSKGDMKDQDFLGLKSLLRYSHICSRFRNFILSIHPLWYRIPLRLEISEHIIDMIARRSGTLGLTVSVDCRWYGPQSPGDDDYVCLSCSPPETGLSSTDSQAILDVIFKYGQRWTDVEFMFHDPLSAQYIQEHPSYAYLTLSSVRTLKFTDILGTMTHYFRYWAMLNLEELTWITRNTLPRSLRSCTTTPRLSICSLDISEPKLTDIVAFLIVNPSLTKLKLSFDTLKDSDLNEPVEPQVASLPDLEHFELVRLSTTDSITQLLKTISCPGTRHLYFSTYSSTAFLGLAQHIRGHYPKLTSVTLMIQEFRSEQSLFFDEILGSLPSTIEKATLGFHSVELRSSRRESTGPPGAYSSYPNLKDLDLGECTYPNGEDFYASLSEILKRHGVTLDHFQPCRYSRGYVYKTEDERMNAIETLYSAGVLIDSS